MTLQAELGFRQASAEGDTEQMIFLLRHPLNINSQGTQSGQTAAHRASIAGKVNALRLLVNLGADLDVRDNNGQTAEEIAHTSAKHLFELIRLAKKTFAARNAFYPETLDHEAKGKDFTDWRAYLKEKRAQCVNECIKEVYDSYLLELTLVKKGLTNANPPKLGNFIAKINQCLYELQRLKEAETTLSETLKNNRTMCACGEASVASYAYLAQLAKTKLPVEELTYVTNNPDQPQNLIGHAVTLINRDQNREFHDLRSWKEAFIIDSYHYRFFFFEFVEHCPFDSAIKELHQYTLVKGATNRLTSFPRELSFPKTEALYRKITKELQERIGTLFLKRCQSDLIN